MPQIPSKKARDPECYVDPVKFREEMYISLENKELTQTAVTMLLKMVNEIVKTRTYKYNEDREDCISQAILDVLMYWDRYDPNKTTNAFSYFTTLIWNGLQKGWKKTNPIKYSEKVSLNSGLQGEALFNI